MVCNVSKVGEDRQWLRIAEVPSTFLIGTGHASRFAVSNRPIGCEGADVIGSNIRFMTSVVSLFFFELYQKRYVCRFAVYGSDTNKRMGKIDVSRFALLQ